MNKSMKMTSPVARQQSPKPLTPEEKQEQIRRSFLQKRASLAEGILFNVLGNPNVEAIRGENTLVDFAIGVATEAMEKLYGFQVKEKSETETETNTEEAE